MSRGPALGQEMRFVSGVIPGRTGVVAGVLGLLAVALVPLSPAHAQGNAASCANGIAVPDPSENPGLVSDCEALLEARDTLAGTGSLNWSADTPMDQWDGITVGGFPQRVIELNLYQRKLTGEIPSGLSRLSELHILNLLSNELSGEIPRELGLLINLQDLSLSSDRLIGGIPAELGRLVNLRRLYVGHGQLSGKIPPDIGTLSNLTSLTLRNNRLSGPIPPQFGSLSKLRQLDLYGNQLSGEVPVEFGGLSNLEELVLGANQLSGRIPIELTNLSNLKRIQLHNNHLEGEIPPGLGGLSNLVQLDLGQNRLSGRIPTALASLSNLESLTLSYNRLNGEILPELGRLSNLTELGLAGNQLSGHIPLELTNLSNLELLYLDHNQLSGEVPPTLGRLSKLIDLRLSDNKLTGQIPPELGDLGSLTILDLDGNRLSDPIPTALGNLASLKILNLEENRLSGPIPPELGSLVNLRWLILSNNRLSGPIPAELGSLSGLTVLHFYGNNLSGDIPSELGRLVHMNNLYIANSNLTGCIPGGLRAAENNDLNRVGLPFCDVLLDDLVVSPGSLAPSFDRYRTYYTADAAAPIVTVRPISRHDATLQVLGEDGHELADADGTVPGMQIGTGTALTTITIKVVSADGAATHTYTVEIRQVLGAPSIGAIEAGGGYLAVSWSAPGEFAEARTASYDLRYIPTTDDETADPNWTIVANAWTASASGRPRYVITGLSAGTQYEVQVRAVGRDGEPADWSGSVTGTPTTPSACVTGGAVTGAINPGIVSDCESLLAARDTLAGSGRLNWSASTRIEDWDGVNLGGTPRRVVGLSLNSRGLDGTIPAELGDLTGLRRLHLFENRLAGPMPAELGRLTSLRSLDLSDNRLTGQVPVDFARLSNLRSLDLSGNRLTGAIPPQLGDLHLDEVDLSGNDLRGCVPPRRGRHGGPVCFAAEGATLTVDARYLLRDGRLKITSVGDAANGLVTLDGATIVYTHDGSETTTGGFTYTVFDGTNSTTALVTIRIVPVNDPPLAVADAVTVQEGGTVSVQAQELLANDSDAEGDTLSITAVGDATNGLVTLDGDTIIYSHDGSEMATASFTYTVTDGTDSTTALVTVTVGPVNDPPVGVDDALAVREGGAISIDARKLLENDTDAEDDALSITAVGDAANGLVTLDGSTVIYRHDGSETTSAGFSYTVSDGTDSVSAAVTITVSPVNDPPEGVDDALTVQEGDTVSVDARKLLENDTDAEDDALSITAVGDAINGIVTLDGSTIIYAHDGSETETGGFTYTVSDGTDSATALVTITVIRVNDPPVGVDDALAVREGGTLSVQAQHLLGNDSDAEGDALTITAVGEAISGLITLHGNRIIYEHDGSETNAGSFAYTISDGTDSTSVLVTITVSPVNDPPSSVDDTLSVAEGGTVAVRAQRLTSNDSDAEGDPLRITDVRDAINGVVTLRGDTITYEHDGAETTAGGFTYTVSDGAESARALVTISVSPVNDPPVGVGDALAVQEGGTISVAYQQLLANDTDAEGDALRITAVGDAINGVVTLDGGAISYEHDGSETLTGSFTYTVSDGTDSDAVVVTIVVSPVADVPVGLLIAAALGMSLLAVAALAVIAVRRRRQQS